MDAAAFKQIGTDGVRTVTGVEADLALGSAPAMTAPAITAPKPLRAF
jgi:hypothetical protein